MLSDSVILKHISRQPKRSAGFKQLVRELGLHGDARRDLNDRLQKLVAGGALLAVDSDRYALPIKTWLQAGSACTATVSASSFRMQVPSLHNSKHACRVIFSSRRI
jgi:hypothetical protein